MGFFENLEAAPGKSGSRLDKFLFSELGSFIDYAKNLTEREKHNAESRISAIRERFDSVSNLFRTKNFRGVNDFFFARENLPLGGKEYWFLYFVSIHDDRQLILTFGRSESGASVNGKRVPKGKVAAVGWFFSEGKKEVFLDGSASLGHKRGILKSDKFSFSGKYPDYVFRSGKTRLKLSRLNLGAHPSFEVVREFLGGAGLGFVNLFLDAGGEMDGKKFDGICYAQKVVAAVPFLPWNWARIVFKDKSGFDIFSSRIGIGKEGYEFWSMARTWDSKGKSKKIENSRIEKMNDGRWLAKGKGFRAVLKPYAFQPFVLSQIGEFHYDEYMAKCEEAVLNGKTRRNGIGILEDAYGIMI